MKVKVLEKFIDKNTGEVHSVGSTFNCTKDRYDEILKVGAFVEEVKTSKKG